MKYDILQTTLDQVKTDCLLIPIFEKNELSTAAKQIDQISHGYLTNILKCDDMQGKLGQSLLLYVPKLNASRVLLIGCGKSNELNEGKILKIFQHAIAALLKTSSKHVVTALTDLSIKNRDQAWLLRQLILTTEEALYRFEEMKSEKSPNSIRLSEITFTYSQDENLKNAKKTIEQAQAIAVGVNFAKQLGNMPGNICTPTYIAKEASKLAKKMPVLSCQVMEEAEMKKLGMGALLAVARGSIEKPKLITLRYYGSKKKSTKPIVLVGKGITFDSGGISIKPSAKMDEMKFDMCGAASVIGTMQAVALLKLPINVVGIVASAENLPSGSANKPGDILKSLSGQTIEVMNTDAEGRLILCDALTYCERFNPEVVIDIATLTGAMVVALGAHPTGLFTNHQPLADDLIKAGHESYDRVWQMPLWEDYQEDIKSGIADIMNLGASGTAGSITAACFLSRFTKKYQWAHLDSAGTAWKSGSEKGSTGRPVSLLTQYIINRCQAE